MKKATSAFAVDIASAASIARRNPDADLGGSFTYQPRSGTTSAAGSPSSASMRKRRPAAAGATDRLGVRRDSLSPRRRWRPSRPAVAAVARAAR